MYSSESLFMIFIDKNNNKYQLGFLKSILFIKFFPIQNKNTTKPNKPKNRSMSNKLECGSTSPSILFLL